MSTFLLSYFPTFFAICLWNTKVLKSLSMPVQCCSS